jgi:hypothetical protein
VSEQAAKPPKYLWKVEGDAEGVQIRVEISAYFFQQAVDSARGLFGSIEITKVMRGKKQ